MGILFPFSLLEPVSSMANQGQPEPEHTILLSFLGTYFYGLDFFKKECALDPIAQSQT